MSKNIGIVIQARSASTRLPNKIFLPLPYSSKKTVLDNVVDRCRIAYDNVIIATTDSSKDDRTETFAKEKNINFFRGSEDDVLKRYLDTSKFYQLDIIVRVTSDCPCVDPVIIKGVVDKLIDSNADYVSNVINRTFPHGLDVEAFTIDAIMKADRDEKDIRLREHVTQPFIRNDNYKKIDYLMEGDLDYHDIRVTIDDEVDYIALSILFDLLKDNFIYTDIIELYRIKPYIKLINSKVYHKKVFKTVDEELIEAKAILKLYGMDNALNILSSTKLL